MAGAQRPSSIRAAKTSSLLTACRRPCAIRFRRWVVRLRPDVLRPSATTPASALGAREPAPGRRRLAAAIRCRCSGVSPSAGPIRCRHPFRASSCNTTFTDPAFCRLTGRCLRPRHRGPDGVSRHLKLTGAQPVGRTTSRSVTKPRIVLSGCEGLDVVRVRGCGKGWLVGNTPGQVGPANSRVLELARGRRTGRRLGGFGVYIAKAVTTVRRLRFTVRLEITALECTSAGVPCSGPHATAWRRAVSH